MPKELDNARRAADIRDDRKGTDEPWKRPGQASQDPSLKPSKKRDTKAFSSEADTGSREENALK